MKFILSVIDTDSNSGSSEELERIDAFNEFLTQFGKLILAAGLGSTNKGILVDNTGGKSQVWEGSLNGETVYSGFWILELENKKVATELAIRASKACNRRVELRPFFSLVPTNVPPPGRCPLSFAL